jgi:hypothetical protein
MVKAWSFWNIPKKFNLVVVWDYAQKCITELYNFNFVMTANLKIQTEESNRKYAS